MLWNAHSGHFVHYGGIIHIFLPKQSFKTSWLNFLKQFQYVCEKNEAAMLPSEIESLWKRVNPERNNL